MAQKILVCCSSSLTDYDSKKKALATTLGVCPDDIVFLPGGVSVSVVDIPDDMIAGREKADKEAEKEAEKAAKAQQEAETEQNKKEIEAIRAATAEAAKNAPPVPVLKPVATDYDTWTVADLHAEATKRDIAGRGQMDKAALVKALQKDDKK